MINHTVHCIQCADGTVVRKPDAGSKRAAQGGSGTLIKSCIVFGSTTQQLSRIYRTFINHCKKALKKIFRPNILYTVPLLDAESHPSSYIYVICTVPALPDARAVMPGAWRLPGGIAAPRLVAAAGQVAAARATADL